MAAHHQVVELLPGRQMQISLAAIQTAQLMQNNKEQQQSSEGKQTTEYHHKHYRGNVHYLFGW